MWLLIATLASMAGVALYHRLEPRIAYLPGIWALWGLLSYAALFLCVLMCIAYGVAK